MIPERAWQGGREMLSLLPELHHGACHVGGVGQGVVGEAAVGVPGVLTVFPGKGLVEDENK